MTQQLFDCLALNLCLCGVSPERAARILRILSRHTVNQRRINWALSVR